MLALLLSLLSGAVGVEPLVIAPSAAIDVQLPTTEAERDNPQRQRQPQPPLGERDRQPQTTKMRQLKILVPYRMRSNLLRVGGV